MCWAKTTPLRPCKLALQNVGVAKLHHSKPRRMPFQEFSPNELLTWIQYFSTVCWKKLFRHKIFLLPGNSSLWTAASLTPFAEGQGAAQSTGNHRRVTRTEQVRMINEHLLTLLAQTDARSFSSSPSAHPCGSTALKQSKNYRSVCITALPFLYCSRNYHGITEWLGLGGTLRIISLQPRAMGRDIFHQLKLVVVTILGWDMMDISVIHGMFVPIIYYTQIHGLRTEVFSFWWEQAPSFYKILCFSHWKIPCLLDGKISASQTDLNEGKDHNNKHFICHNFMPDIFRENHNSERAPQTSRPSCPVSLILSCLHLLPFEIQTKTLLWLLHDQKENPANVSLCQRENFPQSCS